MNQTTKDRPGLGSIAFNPFQYIAGGPALVAGLAMIALTALLAWRVPVHPDGVLDLHLGPASPWWVLQVQGLINWACMAVMVLLAGLLTARGRFRVLDVLGTQALARAPMILAVLMVTPRAVRAALGNVTRYAQAAAEQAGQLGAQTAPAAQAATAVPHAGDIVLLVLMAMVTIASVVWMVALMWRGYRVSCDAKGARAIIAFVAALVLAEAASKVLIWMLMKPMA